ncbi:hypothetical protein L3Q82_016571 [Scortum barcoo]|uniref:Uncharacterized protein n=1 Tax=Scortum barcoo TaxID=214431 RepID=A0ACB8X7E7_9TELE|nr:hypothetical protein L3Q82_016571 [Scortum barcoo]
MKEDLLQTGDLSLIPETAPTDTDTGEYRLHHLQQGGKHPDMENSEAQSQSLQQVRMEVAALSLLLYLVLNSLDCDSARVSPTVSPKRSQFFKYDSFSVSCGEEEEMAEWRVMKRTEDGEVGPCPSSCSITAAYPATDSGVYWCETGPGETSNTVNITVTAGFVIMESPVLPVMEGHDVTLSCRHRFAYDFTTDFYKDGLLIGTSSTGNLSLHRVSRSDEGLYKCDVRGSGESPQSWLAVRGEEDFSDFTAALSDASRLFLLSETWNLKWL